MDFFDEIVTRNVEKIYPEKESLRKKLDSDYKLTIYFGIDPSSPKIHLGHAVALRKLRDFQNLGHKIILLIGDFTGMIGDPTGKDTARIPLTHGQVLENSESYQKQAAKILNFSGKNPAEVKYNSHWLQKLDFAEVIKLASHFTVSQMLERDMFQKRIQEKKPISLHEFLYPVMQGYDSVAMNVDMEVGGTDQTFNMLVGRQLLNTLKNKEKFVLTIPLLEGTDGRKMSKSFNNTIDIDTDPEEMFGKLMSLKDDLILKYFELCTETTSEELKKIKTRLEKENPINIKKELSATIVTIYHGEKDALYSQNEFERVVQNKEKPESIVEEEISIKVLSNPVTFASLVTLAGMASSSSEVHRLAEQGGLFINSVKIENARDEVDLTQREFLIKSGKRRFKKIILVD